MVTHSVSGLSNPIRPQKCSTRHVRHARRDIVTPTRPERWISGAALCLRAPKTARARVGRGANSVQPLPVLFSKQNRRASLGLDARTETTMIRETNGKRAGQKRRGEVGVERGLGLGGDGEQERANEARVFERNRTGWKGGPRSGIGQLAGMVGTFHDRLAWLAGLLPFSTF